MCIPLLAGVFTGGAGAGAGIGLGGVLKLVGAGLSGAAALQGAQAQAASLEASAEFNERQAALARQRGALEAEKVRDQARRFAGSQVANFAASGVQITGSPAGIIDDTASEAARDVATILHGARIQSDNEMFQARISRANASSVRLAAPFRAVAPVIRGASQINWGGLSTIDG